MSIASDGRGLTRRRLIVAAAAAACAGPPAKVSIAAEAVQTQQFADTLAALLAGRTPIDSGVVVELPETAENGNFVPITIAVESPMTPEDHVTTIHVLSTANPTARVATFHLAPVNAVARVQSRMRLARTQDVVVVAELSTGAVRTAKMAVNVSIGGCEG